MKTIPSVLIAALLTATAIAQTPPAAPGTTASTTGVAPELAPLLAKYEADKKAIEAQQSAALAQTRAPYLAVLTAAENKATAAGKTEDLKAILAEQAAVNGTATMPAAAPTGLPKDLNNTRATYLRESARIAPAITQKQQAAASAHLRNLAAVQARPAAAQNKELMAQIAAEKLKVVGSAPAATAKTPSGAAQPKGKNMVVNGDFSQVVDGKPVGWKGGSADMSLEQENGNAFMRAITLKDVWAPGWSQSEALHC